MSKTDCLFQRYKYSPGTLVIWNCDLYRICPDLPTYQFGLVSNWDSRNMLVICFTTMLFWWFYYINWCEPARKLFGFLCRGRFFDVSHFLNRTPSWWMYMWDIGADCNHVEYKAISGEVKQKENMALFSILLCKLFKLLIGTAYLIHTILNTFVP